MKPEHMRRWTVTARVLYMLSLFAFGFCVSSFFISGMTNFYALGGAVAAAGLAVSSWQVQRRLHERWMRGW